MSSLSFYFVLLLSSLFLHVHGATKNYHVVSVQSLLPKDTCSSSQGFNHTGLKVAHRQGPCSSLPGPTELDHYHLLNEDQARVDNLHRRVSTATAKPFGAALDAKVPANDGSSFGTGNYIVSLGFGTPTKHYSVVFDTGSDVTWIQCQPCVSSCYTQKDPIFDPRQSSTYANISCSSAACAQLDNSGCSGSTCLYAVQYGDGSVTVGFFAQDTLTVSSDVLPGFRFGCGERNQGLFGTAAGLLGLGRSPVSMVSQTTNTYSGVFTYCMPSTPSSTGYLSFGPSAAPPNPKLTPMVTDPNNPSFYFLSLVSISVGGRKLSIPPAVFANAGTIIDSGTVISRLPPTAYAPLRAAFKQAMSKYKTAPALSILDTCYDLSSVSSVTVPTVVFTFGSGAAVSMDPSGILYVASASQVCLGFAANGDDTDLGIYGNTQQRTFGVVYNVPKRLIGFAAGGCS